MNNAQVFNDTLDCFTFPETQKLLPSFNAKTQSDSFERKEVSFDDSVFLTLSLNSQLGCGADFVSDETRKSVTDINWLEEAFVNSSFENEVNSGRASVASIRTTCDRSSEDIFCSSPEKMCYEESTHITPNNIVGIDSTSQNYNQPKNSLQESVKCNTVLDIVNTSDELESDNSEIEKNEIVGNIETEIEKNKDNPVSETLNRESTSIHSLQMSAWGLPANVLEKYESKKVTHMFQWQVDCLNQPRVLSENANLIYSAPTSAGKTLVAEIIAVKTILERRKKVIFILPFVSIVREKMFYFQEIFENHHRIRVEGFMGSYNPPGGFNSVKLAICTIEKANNLVNKLLQEGNLAEIGAVVVDELHLLGDSGRGYLLELLLTKIRYISMRDENVKIQIIGMSATVPNIHVLAQWLDAELYVTDFRPVPLYEQAQIAGEVYNTKFEVVRQLAQLPELDSDTDNILQLCLETIQISCSLLIFCPTKIWCENLAQQIAMAFWKLGRTQSDLGQSLRSQINSDLTRELLEQLKYCPVGLDEVLRKTASFGVAFHHAGLTMDERDIVEGAFRNGAIRVLVATSTLSSGVNLPARRVIIRTPVFHGKPLDPLAYRQMIGRAGRMGKDTAGESFLVCQKNQMHIAKELMSTRGLDPIESCLEGEGKLKRAILEIVASGVASTPQDLELFTSCTLLSQKSDFSDNPIESALLFLTTNEFVRLQNDQEGISRYTATSLGKACLSSSIPPEEGLSLFTELEKARQCFVLETELHLIYLVTPYSACNQWGNLDWMFYLDLWEKLSTSDRKVADLVGVQESYIVNATRGKIQMNGIKMYHRFLVHKRFFVALVLQDLVEEKSLNEVCAKFSCNRGMLQSLQLTASTFAGMVTAFSKQLGWTSVELLISQFQDRLQFGVSRDLLDLMRLPILNGKCARALYKGGLETLVKLANSDVLTIEDILHKVAPFETEKMREGETEYELKERTKQRNIWITGKQGLTEKEAAELLLTSARKYLEIDMGLAEAKWEKSNRTNGDTSGSVAVKTTDDNSNFVSNKVSSSSMGNLSCSKDTHSKEEDTNIVDGINRSESSTEEPRKGLSRLQLSSTPSKSSADLSGHFGSDLSLFEDSKEEMKNVSGTGLNCGIGTSSRNSLNMENLPARSFDSSEGDFIAASPDTSTVSVQSAFLSRSCKKRSRKEKENGVNNCETPSKKKKPSRPIFSEDASPVESKIVDVTGENLPTLRSSVKQAKHIALAIVSKKITKSKPTSIGMAVVSDSDERDNGEINGRLFRGRRIEGFAITLDGANAYYLHLQNLPSEAGENLLLALFDRDDLVLSMADCKRQVKLLMGCWDLKQFKADVEDPYVADWILQPEGTERDLQYLVSAYAQNNYTTKLCEGFKDLKKTAEYKMKACYESLIVWHLVDTLKQRLKDQGPQLLKVFENEMVCVKILAKMETGGLNVERSVLLEILDSLKTHLLAIEKKCYSLAGRRFSFHSSTEVGRVLGMINNGSVRRGRVSTRKSILEKMENPLAHLVLQWRKYECIIKKMLQPLLSAIENGKIYGCHTMYTLTGRITMYEPNLQTVAKDFDLFDPITNERQKVSCRRAFVAAPGYVLISADYCQLELRLLAHFSQEELLCKIMKEKADIFKGIAAKWNGINEEEVSETLRNHAKQICYGIIYGMGAKALAVQLQTTEDEARIFMDTFQDSYPGLKVYTYTVVEDCRRNGFVQTIAGRRRYLPNINHESSSTRSQAERQAVNTTIQGSAADLVKGAMVAMEGQYGQLSYANQIKMVLHLHDELMYEVPEKHVQHFASILENTMKNSINLSVPFPVKLKSGGSWGELIEFSSKL